MASMEGARLYFAGPGLCLLATSASSMLGSYTLLKARRGERVRDMNGMRPLAPSQTAIVGPPDIGPVPPPPFHLDYYYYYDILDSLVDEADLVREAVGRASTGMLGAVLLGA